MDSNENKKDNETVIGEKYIEQGIYRLFRNSNPHP